MTQTPRAPAPERESIEFPALARTAFAFLVQMGFAEVEASPTLVRYQKGDVEVDVYHGRRSFEVGAGISYHDSRYSLVDFIEAQDPDAVKQYRTGSATTIDGVEVALEKLSSAMQLYGKAALRGDASFFSKLEAKRAAWMSDYWKDMLAQQLRPQADEAFRIGDYAKVAKLYSQFEDRLSPAELKKLAIARKKQVG